MAPCNGEDDVLVLLVKAPREKLELLKANLLTWASLVRNGAPILDQLLGKLRGSA